MAANETVTALPVNIVRGTQAELITFLVLNMWPSHFAIPLLLIIVFSKRIQRHPTLLNLFIVFIFIGVSSSILVYTGHTSGPEPDKMLCLFQASLLYGVPVMAPLAVLMQVFQMFTVIRAKFKGQPISHDSIRLSLMLVIPYIAWTISIIATVLVGLSNRSKISRERRFFYCSVESAPLTNTLTVIAAVILLLTLILEIWTIVLFYKRIRGIAPEQRKGIQLSLPIRILAFGLYLIIALSISLISIGTPQSPVPDLMIASAATVVVLIFGTQPDILRAACFWRRYKTTMKEISYAKPFLDDSSLSSSAPEGQDSPFQRPQF